MKAPSMCVGEVYLGGIGYADRIAVEENDPLNLLIDREELLLAYGEDHETNSYPHSSSLIWVTT